MWQTLLIVPKQLLLKVTGYSVLGNVYLSLLTKNLWYEEREQLDSGGGGALSQGAGHDGRFFDSIIPGKFICCLARLIRLFGELNCLFLHGYTAYQYQLPSCPAPCDSAPPPPESSCSCCSYQRFLVSELKYTFPNIFRTVRARVSHNLKVADQNLQRCHGTHWQPLHFPRHLIDFRKRSQ